MKDNQLLQAQELVAQARTRAGLCTLVGAHFTMLMDDHFVDEIRRPAYRSFLAELSTDEGGGEEMATGAARMLDFIGLTLADHRSDLATRLGVERTLLFRGVSPQNGPPPPYEAVWCLGRSEFDLLQEISAIYQQSGFRQSPNVHERQDYIGMELDYLCALASCEANAWESEAFDLAKKMMLSQHAFLADHLSTWAPAFIEKALTYARTDFYTGQLMLLRGFIERELKALAAQQDLLL